MNYKEIASKTLHFFIKNETVFSCKT